MLPFAYLVGSKFRKRRRTSASLPKCCSLCLSHPCSSLLCCARSENPCRLRLDHVCWVCCNNFLWVLRPKGVSHLAAWWFSTLSFPPCPWRLSEGLIFSWTAAAIQFGDPISPDMIQRWTKSRRNPGGMPFRVNPCHLPSGATLRSQAGGTCWDCLGLSGAHLLFLFIQIFVYMHEWF